MLPLITNDNAPGRASAYAFPCIHLPPTNLNSLRLNITCLVSHALFQLWSVVIYSRSLPLSTQRTCPLRSILNDTACALKAH